MPEMHRCDRCRAWTLSGLARGGRFYCDDCGRDPAPPPKAEPGPAPIPTPEPGPEPRPATPARDGNDTEPSWERWQASKRTRRRP